MRHNHFPQWRKQTTYPIKRYICVICLKLREIVYHCEQKSCPLWLCEDHMKNNDPHFVSIEIVGVEL